MAKRPERKVKQVSQQQRHKIKRFNLVLNLKGFRKSKAEEIQRNVIDLWRGAAGETLDKLFSRLVPPEVHLVIPRINLVLPTLKLRRAEDFKSLFEQLLIPTLEREVKRQLSQMAANARAKAAASEGGEGQIFRPTRYQLLKSLLEQGRYPKWAGGDNPDALTLFEEMLRDKPKQLARLIYGLRKRPNVARRLVYQFGYKRLETLLPTLLPSSYKKVLKQWQLLRRRLAKTYQQRYGTKLVRTEVDTAVMNYLLSLTKGQRFDERAFGRAVYGLVQERLASVVMPETLSEEQAELKPKSLAEGLYVSEAYAGTYRPLDVLAHFLMNGSLPPWARVEDSRRLGDLFESLLREELPKVQALIERNLDKPFFLDRLILQFSSERLFALMEPLPERTRAMFEAFDRGLEPLLQDLQERDGLKLGLVALRASVWRYRLRQVFRGGRLVSQALTTWLEEALMGLSVDTGLRYAVVVERLARLVRRRKTSFFERLKPLVQDLHSSVKREQSEAVADWLDYEHQLEAFSQAGPTERAALRQRLRDLERRLRAQSPEAWRSRRLNLVEMLKATEAEMQQKELQIYTAKDEETRRQVLESFKALRQEQEASEMALDRLRRLLSKDIAKTLAKPASAFRAQRLEHWLEESQAILEGLATELRQFNLRRQGIEMALSQEGIPEAQQKLLRRNLSKAQKRIKRLEADQATLQTQVKEMQDLVRDQEREAEEVAQQERNLKLDFLVFFLQYGSIPWWAEAYRDTSLESLVLDFLMTAPEQLRTALQRTGKNPLIWRRLAQQLTEVTLQGMLRKLYPNQAPNLLWIADVLDRIRQSDFFSSIRAYPPKIFKWGVLWDLLLQSPSPLNDLQSWSKAVVLRLANQYELPLDKGLDAFIQVAKALAPAAPESIEALSNLPEDEEIKAEMQVLQDIEAEKPSPLDLLSIQDKLLYLTDFLQTQEAGPEAKSLGLDKPADFQAIFYDLIERDAKALRNVLGSLLVSGPVRESLVYLFEPEAFWELVLLLRPAMPLLLKRYLGDLPLLGLKPKQEQQVRMMFLAYLAALPEQKKFDALSWTRYFLQNFAKEANRLPEALAFDWRNRLSRSATPPQSTLELTLLALDIEQVQRRRETTQDPEQLAQIRAQMEELETAYRGRSQMAYPMLLREMLEADVSEPEDQMPIAVIASLDKTLEERQAWQERQPSPDDPIAYATWKRQDVMLEIQIQALKLRRPLKIRQAEAQMEALQAQVQNLTAQIQALEPLTSSPPPPSPPIPPPSPLQAQTQALLKLNQLQQDWAQASAIKYSDERKAALAPLSQQLDALSQELEQQIPQDPQTPLADWLHRIEQNLQNLPYSDQIENLKQRLAKFKNQEDGPKILNQIAQLSETLLPSLQGSQAETEWLQVRSLSLNLAANWTKLPLEQIQTQIQTLSNRLDLALNALDFWSNANQNRLQREAQNLSSFLPKLQQILRQREWDYLAVLVQNYQQSLYQAQIQLQTQTISSPEQITQLLQPIENRLQSQIQNLSNLNNRLQNNPQLQSQIQNLIEAWPNQLAQLQTQAQTQLHHQALTQKQQLQEQSREQQTQVQKLEQELQTLVQTFRPKEDPSNKDPETNDSSPVQPPKKPKTPLILLKPSAEPLYVKNAGIVILWPFFSRLFSVLKYTEKNAFLSEETQFKAAHILQYLVNKRLETPENELVLNKILCGIPLINPIPLSMDFSQDEINTAESLLGGAIANWSRIKNGMEPDALRGTFLNREGNLSEEAERWKLKVEKASLDILLKTLNWGFSLVKLPWMPKPLVTEWDF